MYIITVPYLLSDCPDTVTCCKVPPVRIPGDGKIVKMKNTGKIHGTVLFKRSVLVKSVSVLMNFLVAQ